MTIAKRSESPATSENELIQEDLYSSSPPPNVHKRSHPNATTFTDQKPNIPSTRLSSISPPETPFSEKLSSSKRVTLPSPESMPVDSAVTTIKTGGEVNVILIFQSSTGDMDFQSKVPSSMLRTSTLQQFFHKYSQRSGISLEQFSTLTFDIVFANNESFEVHSSDSAADWRDFKVEIKKLLDETKAAKPRLSEFEIWVKPEKAALTQTVDDVDDGLDGL